MPHKIALITDSTCDIPATWREQYEITVIPMTVIFGDQQYLEGVDISPEEFYQRLPQEKERASTSQPAPQVFLEVYRRLAEAGVEQILTITLSAAMSGTYQSARQAAQDVPVPVHVMDSRSNSMGLGWQVIAAARAREQGGGLPEMLAAAEFVRDRITYYITLDTIDYLSKGGRISEAVRFLNSFLHIKPLIYVKRDTGTVGASIPARSRKAALDGLYKEFFRNLPAGKNLHLTVLHNAALPEAEELAERVRQEYTPQEMFISIVSPVLGVHTGPRAVALCGYMD